MPAPPLSLKGTGVAAYQCLCLSCLAYPCFGLPCISIPSLPPTCPIGQHATQVPSFSGLGHAHTFPPSLSSGLHPCFLGERWNFTEAQRTSGMRAPHASWISITSQDQCPRGSTSRSWTSIIVMDEHHGHGPPSSSWTSITVASGSLWESLRSLREPQGASRSRREPRGASGNPGASASLGPGTS